MTPGSTNTRIQVTLQVSNKRSTWREVDEVRQEKTEKSILTSEKRDPTPTLMPQWYPMPLSCPSSSAIFLYAEGESWEAERSIFEPMLATEPGEDLKELRFRFWCTNDPMHSQQSKIIQKSMMMMMMMMMMILVTNPINWDALTRGLSIWTFVLGTVKGGMERHGTALSWTRRWKIICHMSGCKIHHEHVRKRIYLSMSVWLCAFIMKALVKHFESNSTRFLFCWGFSDGTAAGRSGRSCWKVQIQWIATWCLAGRCLGMKPQERNGCSKLAIMHSRTQLYHG